MMKIKKGQLLLVVALILGGVAYGFWHFENSNGMPDGFVKSNGRIEAERIDVSVKFPGRLKDVLVKEGDMVKAGQVLVTMDTAQLSAQLREAKASVWQAKEQINQSEALLSQRQSELGLAEIDLTRTDKLVKKGIVAEKNLDHQRTTVQTAKAATRSAKAQVAYGKAALEAAKFRVERLEVELSEHKLTAPRDGRVQYRLKEPGEVLGAGARVLTLIDLTEVHMSIYLPTGPAGRIMIGTEARIIFDAAPELVIPAKVSFVASQAQFTPKYVETASEREKMMFRVKLKIPTAVLLKHSRAVKTGISGTGYVKISPGAKWPDWLLVRLPK